MAVLVAVESPAAPRPRARRAALRVMQVYPNSDFYTGAAIQMFELARGLAGRGHDVAVVTRPSPLWAARAREAGLAHHALPMASAHDLRSAWALAGLARRHGTQVLHAHKGRARTLALLAGLAGRRPVLVANRGVSFPLGLNRLGYRTRRVDAVVAVCESIRRGMIARGVPAAKIHTIHSGTDTERFHPGLDGAAVRQELRIPPRAFLVVQVGVRSVKGNDDVMTAMARVAGHVPGAMLLIVGARRVQATLDRARQKGLRAGQVRVLGYREDIPRILAAADCSVDASWAGLGITGALRESLAVGTPVIATALEGNPDLVADGETGLLVPPRDPGAIARAVTALAADPALRTRLGQAGHRLVAARFSLEAKLDAMEALYEGLVAARAGGS
jgi:glycosyltransferase involved in cell wall biosynthesis